MIYFACGLIYKKLKLKSWLFFAEFYRLICSVKTSNLFLSAKLKIPLPQVEFRDEIHNTRKFSILVKFNFNIKIITFLTLMS